MTIDADKNLEFSPMHRLQWEEAQQKHVILYPEGMVELNQTSNEILQICDGSLSAQGIVETLENKFETTGLSGDIFDFLQIALSNGWIRYTD